MPPVQANTEKLKNMPKAGGQGSLAALEDAGVKVQSRFAEREAALSLLSLSLKLLMRN